MSTDLRAQIEKLHDRIMNIRPRVDNDVNEKEFQAYRRGHRDARHEAAELVLAILSTAEKPQEKCRRCAGSGMVAYWDGSALAGEMCPDCDSEAPPAREE